MAPRSQQAAEAAPSLLSLPPEVLLRILASVPLADRLSRVALTCKQLGTLCTVPELLGELDVRISGEQTIARTAALMRFCMRHGEHVHSLQLDVVPEGGEDGAVGIHSYEIAALLSASLVACSARQTGSSSGLRRLSISPDTTLAGTGCLPLLTSLEELSLPGRNSSMLVWLGGTWRQHTALRSAHLSGRLVCEGEGPALPPSLTRLCIEGDWSDEDCQLHELEGRVLAGLPALRCLELCDSAYSSGSLAAISSLTALTRLALCIVKVCPPVEALAALAPSLRALEVHGSCGRAGDLDRAIGVLTALESLALDFGAGRFTGPEVPSAVMGLPKLQRLSLSYYSISSQQAPRTPPTPALPLSHLHWVALPLVVALRLTGLLEQARSLETLCLLLPPASTVMDAECWSAFWQFVATHPPLRSLPYEVPADSPTCSLQLLDALVLLQRRRPALQVRRLVSPADRNDSPPACWAELRAA